MKISKNTYIYIIISVGAIITIFFLMNISGGPSGKNIQEEISPSPQPDLTVSPSPKSSTKPIVSLSPKPTSGIIIRELMSYKDWVEYLDPINRRLLIAKDCASIMPSQVDYPNNVEIMIDNTLSSQDRILKIGGNQYFIDANDWIMVTLSSKIVPAKLPIFCGDMELGQIDLK